MKRVTRFLHMLLLVLLLTVGIFGCGMEESYDSTADSGQAAETLTEADSEWAADDSVESTEAETENPADSESEADDTSLASESQAADDLYLDPDGSYDSKDDVALYIYLYGELPSNYITKKEAQNLGWSGGSLEAYAEGKCIGGSRFGNYEGILPEGEYHECDIDTLGASGRGAKRIVYSDDGNIYYTDDHYETFTLLYTSDGPVTEKIVYPQ